MADYKTIQREEQPQDKETELAVLSTIMGRNEVFNQYSDLLTEDLFYYDREKAVFRCIRAVIDDGKIAEVNALSEFAKCHDVGTYVDSSDFISVLNHPATTALEQDIMRLRDYAARRALWVQFQTAAKQIKDITIPITDVLEKSQQSVEAIYSDDGQDSPVKSSRQVTDELFALMDEIEKGRPDYIVSGFAVLDDFYMLSRNALTVIAARTSVGKTAFALNIAFNVASNGVPVAYYSLEMGAAELWARIFSSLSEIPAKTILKETKTDSQKEKLRKLDQRVGSLSLYVDEEATKTPTFDKTIRSIRKLAKTKKIKLAIIDYLQIYSQVGDNTEASLSYMARSAKNIARELHISVILLSQLHRSGPHPQISDLRGSGQIEESADNIILIDRPEAYPDNSVTSYEGEYRDASIHNTAKMIVAKGRNSGTGSRLMNFNPKLTQFSDMGRRVTARPMEDEDADPF